MEFDFFSHKVVYTRFLGRVAALYVETAKPQFIPSAIIYLLSGFMMETFMVGSPRIRYEAFIACSAGDTAIRQLGSQILKGLAHRYGGASIVPATGAWAGNGNSDDDIYQDISIETGIKVVLSVIVEQSDLAYRCLQTVLSDAISESGLPIRYVHVDRFACEALHFDIQSLEFCGSH